MAAPSTAYAIKDGNFVKAVIRNGSTPYYIYVAKFLSGAQSDGGYSTASATMRSNIKSLFRLDELVDVREKQEDGSMKVIGFVGCVKHGSVNASYHASKRVSGARVRDDDGNEYDVLNDAGLNRLPQVSYSVKSRYANYIEIDVSAASAFYSTTQTVQAQLTYDSGSTTGTSGLLQRKTWSGSLIEHMASPSSTTQGGKPDMYSGPITAGKTGSVSVSATNEEGTASGSGSFTALDRIRVPRLTLNYASSEPTYVDQLENTAKDIDFFEDEFRAMWDLPEGGGSASASQVYAYEAPRVPSLVIANYAPTGWYSHPVFNTSTLKKAFRVVSGQVQYWKEVTERPMPTLTIYVTMTEGPHDAGRAAPWSINLLAKISVPSSAGDAWTFEDGVTQVRVEFAAASSGSNYERAGIRLYTKDAAGHPSSTAVWETNLTGMKMRAALTISEGTGSTLSSSMSTIGGVYMSQEDMASEGGDWYMDVGSNSLCEVYPGAVNCYLVKNGVKVDYPYSIVYATSEIGTTSSGDIYNPDKPPVQVDPDNPLVPVVPVNPDDPDLPSAPIS